MAISQEHYLSVRASAWNLWQKETNYARGIPRGTFDRAFSSVAMSYWTGLPLVVLQTYDSKFFKDESTHDSYLRMISFLRQYVLGQFDFGS